MTKRNHDESESGGDDDVASKSQPKLKLYYFNIKGKGEPIRLFCAYHNLKLEDVRFQSYEEFLKMKESGQLAFGQVPLLDIDDSKYQLVQTAAILRYLAKIAGDGKSSYPSDDPILAAKIDAVVDQEVDAFIGTTVASYSTRFGIPIDDEEYKKKIYELQSSDILPRHLTNLEKILKESTTGWLVNTEEPTIADFVWYSRLKHYIPEKEELSDDIKSLKNFKFLQEFITKFDSLPAIQEYYK